MMKSLDRHGLRLQSAKVVAELAWLPQCNHHQKRHTRHPVEPAVETREKKNMDALIAHVQNLGKDGHPEPEADTAPDAAAVAAVAHSEETKRPERQGPQDQETESTQREAKQTEQTQHKESDENEAKKTKHDHELEDTQTDVSAAAAAKCSAEAAPSQPSNGDQSIDHTADGDVEKKSKKEKTKKQSKKEGKDQSEKVEKKDAGGKSKKRKEAPPPSKDLSQMWKKKST